MANTVFLSGGFIKHQGMTFALLMRSCHQKHETPEDTQLTDKQYLCSNLIRNTVDFIKDKNGGNALKKFSYFYQKINFDIPCKLSAKYFFLQKIDFDIPWKLSPKVTICMKCQSLFSRKNKKK